VAEEIMPEKFTLSELQNAYEIILDKELDKRNFRKKLKELDISRNLRRQRWSARTGRKAVFFQG
jgi:8-oxo-dGTP diphosphatase